jgi:hypothetical protein
MTETELQQRLLTSVEEVDAPSDLVHRARQGGAKRLRRRWFTTIAAVTVSMAAVAGVAVAGQDLLPWRNDQVMPAAVPGPGDPYGFLMNRPTKGDLAGDQSYLDQVVSTWEKSHAKSPGQSRGIFDDLRGKPKVAWAGQTPGGKAAIVVQQSYLHNHADIHLDQEGLYTLIGFVGEGADGSPTLVADSTRLQATAWPPGSSPVRRRRRWWSWTPGRRWAGPGPGSTRTTARVATTTRS